MYFLKRKILILGNYMTGKLTTRQGKMGVRDLGGAGGKKGFIAFVFKGFRICVNIS